MCYLADMAEEPSFRFTNAVLLVPLGLMLGIWTVYLMEIRMGVNLNQWGIYPRTLKGLVGVVTGPFIHSSPGHLYNNTLPLVILSAALFYFYRPVAWKTLLLGTLLTGLITWAIGRSSYHIGASGVIYLLASFIFFKGVFSRYYRLVALSLIVVFLYGGMLWYIFPIQDEISWEGHLAGALSGLVLAYALKVPLPVLKHYAWEKDGYREEADPFMRHFDPEGNFIEHPDGNTEEPPQIRYHYREGRRDPGSQEP